MSQRRQPNRRRTVAVAAGIALTGSIAATGAAFAVNSSSATTTASTAATSTKTTVAGHQLETLGRGAVSVHSSTGNLVSWRLLATDASTASFDVYRDGTKIKSGITGSTNYLDKGAAATAKYTIKTGSESATATSMANGYLRVPLKKPAGGTKGGVDYTYTANDASVADLDGDGEYEIVLKWDPTSSKDNSQSGYTGNVYVDAYELDGTRLWRIDLGKNIRAGAHYTQFQAYDYDGDGKAEVAMKTADGTVDGKGTTIGSATADYRNSSGYVLTGPEYLTMFNGQTGAAASTVDYTPARGTVSSWGDSYGNRVDRFLAGTAYLSGSTPSLIEARGYYTRSVVTAWDYKNGKLTQRWQFDSNKQTTPADWAGQGNHQLSVADVDSDGKDEIIYGSMALDDTGKGLWTTKLGHGDTLHVGDLIPSRAGLEVYKVRETKDSGPADFIADAATGKIISKSASCGCDTGRGVAEDIYAGSAGAEQWSSSVSGLRNSSGTVIGSKPSSTNFLVWWDGDASRELLDSNKISKWAPTGETRLLTADGVHSNNSTKATPSLSGDILGDWREEVIWPETDDTALRIYSTPIETSTRITTLMQDSQYRVAVAWQNTAYNQPPHLSYALQK
ncbi:rhamnogalacturonan lyase [Kineosporia sp. J2-2]|uniref:Rhamnogalacturonan lyase n=1 Tax=Kineosporia corallincola TaxID=2835133 RepID=A0ABS5THS3_9ACTN|nr:rhamnogalacturonan lyase [Kineosporia corallincola]MBT0770630.1 rhamnogalacturonan lyase [Kineosporia corallincola]